MRKIIALLVFMSIITFSTSSFAKVIRGTNGDDTITIYATAGEPPIVQDYLDVGGTGPNGEPLRNDPDNEINDDTRTFFTGHPIHHKTYRVWGLRGADDFKVWTFISGKPEIVRKHRNNDDTINWDGNGVAGENNEVHDHWVDYFSTVIIQDFNKNEDTLEVRGHTVALKSLRVTRRGDTVIWVQSQQGNGGGAHDEDVLGRIIVRGVALSAGDVTFNHQNDGIMETFTGFERLVRLYDRWAKCRPKRARRCRNIVNRIERLIIRDK